MNEINVSLKENGLFYLGIYGGEDFEREYIKSDVSDAPCFFSYHIKEHLETKLENYFEIISSEQFEVDRGAGVDIVQSIVMRKKIGS